MFLSLLDNLLILTEIPATVPTLVVPFQKTLHEDVESRYKAITETKVRANIE